MEQSYNCGRFYYVVVKTKELSQKDILSVRCTICGAATGAACELQTAAPCTEPHRDRTFRSRRTRNEAQRAL